jgi:DNA-binding response OmpR family regulator
MAASRILSICYETVLQSLRAQVLISNGHVVTCATSQDDAVELIARDQADCVLLGFTLSAEEQSTMIRLVRQTTSKPPVLVMSRNSEVIRLASGAVDPLAGPAQLLHVVAKLLKTPTDIGRARATSAK